MLKLTLLSNNIYPDHNVDRMPVDKCYLDHKINLN